MFTIDGNTFNVFVTKLQRSFQVLDGDNAGRLLDGSTTRDIVGTYYNYTMELDASHLSRQDYDRLYEMISAPVDYHKVVMPYGQSQIAFDAYVTAGTDNLLIANDMNVWSELSIQFIAMKPYRV